MMLASSTEPKRESHNQRNREEKKEEEKWKRKYQSKIQPWRWLAWENLKGEEMTKETQEEKHNT